MKIIWSPLAVERLEEISDFIAYDKPSAAGKWIDSIFGKVELLKFNPDLGRVVPEIETSSIRELLFGNYRIIYRHTGNSINVLTVRSCRQLLEDKDLE
ncbi:MAG: type II toxin-antitoxin system RelE/ParE family toxin [Fibrobacterota bacterium]